MWNRVFGWLCTCVNLSVSTKNTREHYNIIKINILTDYVMSELFT